MILQIIGFACLAHLIADMSQYFELPQKPFQCNLCVGYWISFIPFIIQWGWVGFLLAAITGVTSDALYRIINRL
jgi:hypothetical protein